MSVNSILQIKIPHGTLTFDLEVLSAVSIKDSVNYQKSSVCINGSWIDLENGKEGIKVAKDLIRKWKDHREKQEINYQMMVEATNVYD